MGPLGKLACACAMLSAPTCVFGAEVNKKIVDCGGTAALLRETLLYEAEQGRESAHDAATAAGAILFQSLWIIAEDTDCGFDVEQTAELIFASGRKQMAAISRKAPNLSFEQLFATLTKRLDECRAEIGAKRFATAAKIVKEEKSLPCGAN